MGKAEDKAMAAALIGTRSFPAGLRAIQSMAIQARAYHRLRPYPIYNLWDWQSENRGPLPRCLPLPKTIVRRGAKFLFGKPLQIKVAKNPKLQEILRDAWTKNQMDARLVAMAERGAIEGGIVLKFAYDSTADPQFSFQSLSIIDEVRLFFHPHDRQKLLMARVQYPYFDAATNQTMWYREEWTAEEEVHYEPVSDEAIQAAGKGVDADNFEGWQIQEGNRKPNKLGMIPMLYIQNIATDDVWGAGDLWEACSDGDAMFRIIDRINITYHLMDRSNQFDSEINPIFIDADVDENDIDKPLAPGEGLQIESTEEALAQRAQAKVVLPEARGSLRPAMMEYAKDLRKQVLDATGTVIVDQSEFTNKGNLTTAVLEQLYQPQIESTGEKRKTYGTNGLCRFLTMAARAAQAIGADMGVTADPATSDVQIGWMPYFEPSQNEKTELVGRTQEEEIAGYLPHKRAVARVAQMEGIEDIDVLEKELEAEPRPSPTETTGNSNPVQNADDAIKGLTSAGGAASQ